MFSNRTSKLSIVLLFILYYIYNCSCSPSTKTKTYYEILEVLSNATQKEIRKSYFNLVKQYHPDKNEHFDDTKKIRDKFEEISNAYEILSNEETRAEYDRLLQYGQKEFKPQKSDTKSSRKEYTFKDPYKAYEEALQKEAEEALREKVFTYASIIFGSLLVIFTGWVVTKLIVRTKIYQKMEKNKKEIESRKILKETKEKRD